MGDKVKDFLEKAKGLLKRLPKKIIIIAAAVLAVVIVAAVVVLGNKPYAVLVTEVSNEEAVTIMNLLDEMGVTDYRLEGNDTILVPESQEAQLKARLLIDRLIRRQEEGLSTPKQIRCLERYGFRQVGTWSFDQASAMISRLAANNWRIPFELNVSAYRP